MPRTDPLRQRDYASLVAAGKAEQANREVDPTLYTGDGKIDHALLTDEVLHSASERITNIRTQFSAGEAKLTEVSVGDTVKVSVNYDLGASRNDVTLRVKKLPNSWGPFERWAVIDPLLVPVLIETNLPAIPTAQLGAATVPTSGAERFGYPQHIVLMYPGAYKLTGDTSKYLDDSRQSTDRPGELILNNGDETETVRGSIQYEATDALYEKVNALIPDYVDGCLQAGAAMPDNCPFDLWLRSDFATFTGISEVPVVDSIVSAGVDYRADGMMDATLQFMSRAGTYAYSSSGEDERDTFWVYGWIEPHGDEVTITFRRRI